MSDPIREARELVRDDLERFEATLVEALRPQAPYLSETDYEIYRRGKKLRPLMLLLSARASTGDALEVLPEKVIKSAVSLEMLHVATLIHDDIVDQAPKRRGLETVYSERGAERAVLIGDMQFIQAIRGFADGIDAEKDMQLVRMVLDAGFKVCCGELDEIMTDPAWDSELLLHRYFETIDRKTSALFALACESGATLVDARTRITVYLSRFGRRFGKAFQIMDDIFDFVRTEAAAGKLPGTDLQQGRLTLPVLYILDSLPPGHPVRRLLNREPCTGEEVAAAVAEVCRSDGLLRAYSDARRAALEANDFLRELPQTRHRDALEAICMHVIDRDLQRADG
ncbi:MAG: polyprenyl synthetase family protein [Enhygromyxa sp.]